MQKKLLENPFDIERNYFAQQIQELVPYLKKASQKLLKKMYYMSSIKFFEDEQVIFEVKQPCNALYFVMQGVVAIEIYDRVFGTI